MYGYLTKAVIQEVPPPGPRAPSDSVGPSANAATAEWVQQHTQVVLFLFEKQIKIKERNIFY